MLWDEVPDLPLHTGMKWQGNFFWILFPEIMLGDVTAFWEGYMDGSPEIDPEESMEHPFEYDFYDESGCLNHVVYDYNDGYYYVIPDNEWLSIGGQSPGTEDQASLVDEECDGDDEVEVEERDTEGSGLPSS